MSFEEFIVSPWLKSHHAFEESTFNIKPAPEFSTGEVILASLYRSSGLKDVSEKGVASRGTEFRRSMDRDQGRPAPPGRIGPETFQYVVDRLVQGPKLAKQSSQRALSLTPIIPDVAIYSGSARVAGNPWNPGQLVKRMIGVGAPTGADAESCWAELHMALSVNEEDDVWARWLLSEFDPRRPADVSWSKQGMSEAGVASLPEVDRVQLAYPARQFVIDLRGVMAAKSVVTRRQWTTLLESLLRIATASHVLWLCDVSDRIWRVLLDLLQGHEESSPTTADEVRRALLNVRPRMLSFGNPAVPTIKSFASRYLSARLGINCVLWKMEGLGIKPPTLASADDLLGFFGQVRANVDALRRSNTIDAFHKLGDQEVRTIACKKGVGNNLLEFCQYALGQRQTLDTTLRGYDQGYFLKKRGDARSAPWVLSLGPAAVLAMVHCCLHEVDGPRSIQRLAVHLAHYGIEFDLHGVNDSELGRQLRMLGLVLDSPDAESGMLLVPPFSSGSGVQK